MFSDESRFMCTQNKVGMISRPVGSSCFDLRFIPQDGQVQILSWYGDDHLVKRGVQS